MSEQNEQSSVVEFAPLQFPPIEFGPNVSDEALAELTERYKDPDASDEDGYEHCKNGCRELSALRTGVEGRRLDIKRPITDWVRKHVDDRGKDLIRRIKKIEAPVRVEKERIDEIKQAEARQAAEAEHARVDGIQANINKITATAREQNPSDTAADYQQHITWLGELEINEEVFGEFVEEAETARDAALFKLTQWEELARQREEDDRRRKAEQAEIDQRKKDLDAQAETQRVEAERIESEKKAAAEREESEKKVAKEEADRLQREKDDAEERRIGHIRALLVGYADARLNLEGKSSAFLTNSLSLLRGDPPKEDEFQECLTEAREAWQETLNTLELMKTAAEAREEKQRVDEEARLPDKDKLLRWCDAIAAVPEPEVLNEKAQKTLRRYAGDLSKFTERLRNDIGKL